MIDLNYDINDNYLCNTTSGDFGEINLDSSIGLFKQGDLINSSICFNMTKVTLQSDYKLLGKGFELVLYSLCH